MWLWSKEAATGIVRTVMPFAWTWAATNLAVVTDFAETVGITQEGFVLIAGGLFYTLIRVVAEKVPQVGWLLGVNRKPAYDI